MNSRIYTNQDDPEIAAALLAGKVGVMPSDTQYGLFCIAEDQQAVERVYAIRNRNQAKPCVVLAASLEQLLDIDGLDRNTLLMAERYWPGPVSVVVPCKKSLLPHIHRGTSTIALRVPDKPDMQALLEKTGLLMAPSANPEGQPPAATVAEAHAYFGESVDFYVDAGELANKLPSTIISFDEDGLVTTLRQGAVAIQENGDIA